MYLVHASDIVMISEASGAVKSMTAPSKINFTSEFQAILASLKVVNFATTDL